MQQKFPHIFVFFALSVVIVGSVLFLRQSSQEEQTVTPSPTTNAETISADFVCSDGKNIRATFKSGTVMLVLSTGRELELSQAVSASGARYANADESFVFWNKGNTAFIEENGRTTYAGCVTNSSPQ